MEREPRQHIGDSGVALDRDAAGLGDGLMAPEPLPMGPRRERALIAAYEAALVVAAELDLETLLQRIVDLARRVVPARYAALGVADDDGTLSQFIFSGLDQAEVDAIGPLPMGHGLLGVLIREGKPLLVPDISADPRSVGFPPNHPPMRRLLGVPILHGERALGNLYLCEREDDAPFDREDLVAVQALAAHAATAIERARLYRAVEDGRRLAEAQRDQLRVILDNLPAGVMIVGLDERIELANTAALWLIFGESTPPGLLPSYGRDYHLCEIDGPPIPSDQRPVARALQGEPVRNRQLVLERADGRRLPSLVQAAPLRTADGAITGAVVVLHDVTRLREAEQLKDDFLSLVSHEFRTPLTAIHGGAHLLARQGEALDEETRGELLTDIVTESERLDGMLTNMLSLTAIMAGRLAPASEPMLVGAVARSVVAETAPRAPRHHFIDKVPNGAPPADGDPALLAQVLRNLYENAIKYAPNGGPIETTATWDDRTVSLHIKDEGSGIAAEHVASVFERFRRPGADPTVRGMGLGLYLSRHLVEVQGGRIAAASPGPGLGATFSVTLPRANREQGLADQ
jgi:signal transduction histidine kinase